MELSALHERMHAVVGHVTYRALGDATDQHPETVRRYMQGQSPSVEFLASLCASYDVNAQWLLTGTGPIKQSAARAHALRDANPGELLSAVAQALEKLAQRVDRLEAFVQMLESRVRQRAAGPGLSNTGQNHGAISEAKDPIPNPGGAAAPAQRAKRIADAVAERSHADAGRTAAPGGRDGA